MLGTEVKFDNDKDSKYPPIEMKLDNGKTVSIIGKIDRIDIAKMPDGKFIRIIDYKSSTKDIDLNKFIAGLQLLQRVKMKTRYQQELFIFHY